MSKDAAAAHCFSSPLQPADSPRQRQGDAPLYSCRASYCITSPVACAVLYDSHRASVEMSGRVLLFRIRPEDKPENISKPFLRFLTHFASQSSACSNPRLPSIAVHKHAETARSHQGSESIRPQMNTSNVALVPNWNPAHRWSRSSNEAHGPSMRKQ